jgi:hypothetical protein
MNLTSWNIEENRRHPKVVKTEYRNRYYPKERPQGYGGQGVNGPAYTHTHTWVSDRSMKDIQTKTADFGILGVPGSPGPGGWMVGKKLKFTHGTF